LISLKQILRLVFVGNIKVTFLDEKIRKAILINTFTILSCIILFLYSINYVFEKNYTRAIILSVFFILCFANLIFFKIYKKYNLAGNLVVFFMALLAIVLLTYAGTGVTGLFWFYLFPFFAFFILGRKTATIYVVSLIIIAFFLLKFPFEFTTHYPLEVYSRFIISIIAESLFVYIFETIRERTHKAFIFADRKKNEFVNELRQQREEMLVHKDELETQNRYINEQNRAITDSIHYAETIQSALLPPIDDLSEIFDYFLIHLPKNIVSGDFYWYIKINDKVFIAVVDCTGHGVPGAFMSVIGANYLNDIIVVQKEFSVEKVLTLMDTKVTRVLRQKTSGNRDGMDVCLVSIDEQKNVEFAGAKRPLIRYNSITRQVERYKGTRRSVGGNVDSFEIFDFEKNTFEANKNDVFYLTTDGIFDQHNIERKKFGTMQFISLVGDVSDKDLSNQREVILSEFISWQNTEYQTDDVTILAIKI